MGSGRGVKLEVDRDDERDGPLAVAAEDELGREREEVEGSDGEVSDEPVAVASKPLTAQAQMGGEVAGCAPQAKPVHELDTELGSS